MYIIIETAEYTGEDKYFDYGGDPNDHLKPPISHLVESHVFTSMA